MVDTKDLKRKEIVELGDTYPTVLNSDLSILLNIDHMLLTALQVKKYSLETFQDTSIKKKTEQKNEAN